ncbi:MAG: BrnT family toxin [Bdellovibrionaceae bacterium]|nr:BrnT family toxin [Pseudobdellovibrionaceae bacterium]
MLITCNGFKFFYNRFVHGVPFREAAECIFSTQAIVIEDPKHSTETETRYNLIATSPAGRVLFVGFCKRQNGFETRIISARRANRKHRKLLAAKFGTNLTYRAIKHKKPTYRMRFLW